MLSRIGRRLQTVPKLARPFGLFKPVSTGIPHVAKSNRFTDFLNKILKRNTKSKKGGSGGGGPNFEPIHWIGFLGVGTMLIAVYYQEYLREMLGLYQNLDFQEYSKMLTSQSVNRLTIVKISGQNIDSYKVLVRTKEGRTYQMQIGNLDHFMYATEQQLSGNIDDFKVDYRSRLSGMTLLVGTTKMIFYTVGVAYFAYFLLTRSSKKSSNGLSSSLDSLLGISEFSKSRSIKVEGNIKTTFKDVAGLEQAKIEIQEFVDFLKNPDKYKEMGAKIPKGVLLSGPPGTGKTLLAKAVAGEAGVNFMFTSGSEFVEMFVGVGAARVRDLFKSARESAPCIIFIDEIDAVGMKRDTGFGSGSDEKNATLNQILVELDGFGTDSKVVVFAATNRKELLDPALTRTGRFDRAIDVNLPNIDERKKIFEVHLKPLKLSDEKTPEGFANRLASLTPGFSGSDIASICNEAAILAARNQRTSVTTHDFEMAVERIIGGVEQKKIVSQEERKTVAIHESGHAVVSWFLEGGMPLLKLTIIPRSKGALGFAQYLPNESSLQTKEELLEQICSILGGRIAEKIFFGKVTTGAYDDLQKVYGIAHNFVTKVGFSDAIGYVNYPEHQGSGVKRYSNETNRLIDEEIKRIVDECEKKTTELVLEKKDLIQKLADRLLEKETLDLTEIIKVLGPRPFAPKSSFKAFLEEVTKAEEEKAASIAKA